MNTIQRALWAAATVLALSQVAQASTPSTEAAIKDESKATQAPPKQTPKKNAGLKAETPNTTTKNSQASGTSDDASAKGPKKKIEELFDTPNPNESKVQTQAGKALGVETGTRGSGVPPIDPRKTTMPPDPLGKGR